MIWRSWVRTPVGLNLGCIVLLSYVIFEPKIHYAKIKEVNLSAFVYGLFHEDYSPIFGTNSEDWREMFMKQSVNNADKLTFVIFVHKALHWALYHVWFESKVELHTYQDNSHNNFLMERVMTGVYKNITLDASYFQHHYGWSWNAIILQNREILHQTFGWGHES